MNAEFAPDRAVREVQFTLADLLVSCLERIGVSHVFGIPGGAIEPLYDALARSERRGGVRHVLARHESGAAFMADGYARETGSLGVCCSTSGPGATNMLTGVASAFDNNIPLLVITGQPALPGFGRRPLQESSCTGVDVLAMFSHCTLYNTLVSHPNQLEAKLVTALQRAVRGPRGPVHLSIPIDVFRSVSTRAVPAYDLRRLMARSCLVDEASAAALFDILSAARKIVIVIGAGAAEAAPYILQYAELTGASFVTTPDGKGLVNACHPGSRGVFGFAGHPAAEAELRDPTVDVILAVGTRMGEWNSGGWSDTVLNERLVHVDESDEDLENTPMARLHVRGRIRAVFENLLVRTRRERGDRLTATPVARDPMCVVLEPAKALSNEVPIKPQRLMNQLGSLFPPQTRFLADTGNSVSWATHYLHLRERRHSERRAVGGDRPAVAGRRKSGGGWLRVTMNFAAMGWAIGGAVGTALACPESPVVCITGDGSVLMNGQEISTAVAEGCRIVFVVLNDGALGMVRHGQRLAGAESIGALLPRTDFAALGRALGARGVTVRSAADLEALDVEAMLTEAGPVVLDVHVDPEEVPPMGVRTRVLRAAV